MMYTPAAAAAATATSQPTCRSPEATEFKSRSVVTGNRLLVPVMQPTRARHLRNVYMQSGIGKERSQGILAESTARQDLPFLSTV
jgi:hypothetical protein